jgi:hypothetical protein
MTEHLLINPNKLYLIYSPDTIKEYYNYDFFPLYASIDNDIFYDILNSLHIKELSNLHRYLYKQWELTKKNDELINSTPIKRRKHILLKEFKLDIYSKEEFNHNLTTFISNDKIVGLYIMNKLLKFLYPC